MATNQALNTPQTAQIGKHSDLILALIVALVISLLIIPIPTPLIDALIIANLILAVVVLLVTMYNNEPLQFSMFPTLLLVLTLFRLGLYISTTRAILSSGSAGNVVDAFGSIIIGDNFVVGIIIFLILFATQYIVITSGTTRVSEVTARFTLDAMPGKQMAIDADLNSGIITEDEAKIRRRNVQREADFYGAMDGASKFVRGDATASIIIAVVNLLGGFIIGATQQGMDIMTSLQTFGRIAIGAGLAIQVPTILLSTSSGIIVTRVASDADLGQDISRQLFQQPRAILIASALILGFGFVPGLPKIPFFLMAALGLALYYFLNRRNENAATQEVVEEPEEQQTGPEDLISALQVDPIELEIGYGLIPLVDPDQGGEILDRITLMRRQTAMDLGYVVPPIRIRDNIQIPSNDYRIKVKGIDIARGQGMVGQLLAIDSGLTNGPIAGTETKEPAFGLRAYWIFPERREEAEINGYTVVDPTSAIITHLSEITKRYSHELIGRQDVQQLLDSIKENYPVVVEELVPGILTVGEIQQVLQRLLEERVSVRDMVTILESLGDHARSTKNIDILAEYVRQALSRTICRQYQTTEGSLDVIAIDPQIEKEIADSVEYTDQGIVTSLDPATSQKILEQLSNNLERTLAQGRNPIVLCSASIRRPFRKIIERKLPNVAVLSYNEIAPEYELQSVGMVSLA
jgi:flagellar biosynthesis protein FlhA